MVRRRGFLIAGLGTALFHTAMGPSTPADDVDEESARGKRALALVSAIADEWTFSVKPRTGDRVRLKRLEKPLARWSNPEVGSIHGAVFVWTRDDRPELIASMFKWFAPKSDCDGEFHSLCGEPLEGTRGTRTWSTAGKHLDLKTLEGVDMPAQTFAQRTRQMRAIVDSLAIVESLADGQKIPLRAQTQPLYRYASESANVIDGAIFSFVRATDPEAIVMIEAVNAVAKPSWRIGFARMSVEELTATRAGAEIWTCKAANWDDTLDKPGMYSVLRFTSSDPTDSR